jgi:hypothetical protein
MAFVDISVLSFHKNNILGRGDQNRGIEERRLFLESRFSIALQGIRNENGKNDGLAARAIFDVRVEANPHSPVDQNDWWIILRKK